MLLSNMKQVLTTYLSSYPSTHLIYHGGLLLSSMFLSSGPAFLKEDYVYVDVIGNHFNKVCLSVFVCENMFSLMAHARVQPYKFMSCKWVGTSITYERVSMWTLLSWRHALGCRGKTDDLSRLSHWKCIFISNQSKSNYGQYLGILEPWY